MREATAQQGGMSREELAAWATELRAEQGLPARIAEPTTLQHVADLFRLPDQQLPPRRRAG